MIECEIDDMNPQIFGVVMDRLYAAGALEVFYVPVQMKKNRPGTLLTVVAPPDAAAGDDRHRLPRDDDDRPAALRRGPRVSAARDRRRSRRRSARCASRSPGATAASINAVPEFEDCAKLAAAHNLPVKEVQAIAPSQAYGARRRGDRQVMSRFFLTTAIDFVNSRPHLGTAYEKICADVIARYKRLCGVDTRFLMGNDEHSQNVFKKAGEQGLDPLAYCDRMERSSARRGGGSTSRSTISSAPPSRGTRRASPSWSRRIYDAGDIYEGVYEGLVLRQLRGVQAGEGSRQRQLSAAPDAQARMDPGEELLLPAVEVPAAAARSLRRAPGFLQPEIRRNEILRLIESGLEDISVSRAGQSWGIPLPFDPSSVVYVWFDALINYASAVGLGTDRGDVRAVVAGGSARHRQGHHALPRRDLAGDADGGEAAAAAPDLRPRVHDDERPADEQDARQRSIDPIEAADAVRRRSAAAVSGEGDRVRRRRRLLVGALRRALQRRSREQPRQPGQPRHGDGRAVSAGHGWRRLARRPDSSRASASRSRPIIAARWTRFALHEGAAAAFGLIDATNEFIAATAPWALAKDPASADRLTQVLFDAAEAIRLAAVLLAPIMPASSAEILRRVGAPASRSHFDRDGRWRNEGERVLAQDGPLWPRKEQTTVSDNDTEDARAPVPRRAGAPGAAAPARPHQAPSTWPSLRTRHSPRSAELRRTAIASRSTTS